MKRRIGILTSGGDCPGLNACIRGVARASYSMFDTEIVGIQDGYAGLIAGDYKEMKQSDFSGILTLGGTILGTSRQKYIPGKAIVDDEGGEIAINRNRNIFTFVTNIQDETHRYANDYRKRAMKKKSYAATLTAIPGVGEKTSAALLAHFKTVAAVKAASISDLEEVKGISHAKAEMLYNALRNGV